MTMKGFTWIKWVVDNQINWIYGYGSHDFAPISEDCLFAVKENYLRALMQVSFQSFYRGRTFKETRCRSLKNIAIVGAMFLALNCSPMVIVS